MDRSAALYLLICVAVCALALLVMLFKYRMSGKRGTQGAHKAKATLQLPYGYVNGVLYLKGGDTLQFFTRDQQTAMFHIPLKRVEAVDCIPSVNTAASTLRLRLTGNIYTRFTLKGAGSWAVRITELLDKQGADIHAR